GNESGEESFVSSARTRAERDARRMSGAILAQRCIGSLPSSEEEGCLRDVRTEGAATRGARERAARPARTPTAEGHEPTGRPDWSVATRRTGRRARLDRRRR